MPEAKGAEEIRSRVFARVGLVGNPSDGFGGRCISFSLANFFAEVTLTPSDSVTFIPNPDSDPYKFASLDALTQHVKGCGYYGGVRIMKVGSLTRPWRRLPKIHGSPFI